MYDFFPEVTHTYPKAYAHISDFLISSVASKPQLLLHLPRNIIGAVCHRDHVVVLLAVYREPDLCVEGVLLRDLTVAPLVGNTLRAPVAALQRCVYAHVEDMTLRASPPDRRVDIRYTLRQTFSATKCGRALQILECQVRKTLLLIVSVVETRLLLGGWISSKPSS